MHLGKNVHSSQIILISGPTASSKSKIALELAARLGGIIINADALQVYSCWKILSARPDFDNTPPNIPHHLYGHVSCLEKYSVGVWIEEVGSLLQKFRGNPIIIIGGTGLYFHALTNGLSPIPTIKKEIQEESQILYSTGKFSQILAELKKSDPKSYEYIDRENPRRIQRAWEVFKSTGKGLHDWNEVTTKPLVDSNKSWNILLEVDKSELENRIRSRLLTMIDRGAIAECRKNLSIIESNLPSGKVIGAKEFAQYLKGNCSKEYAIEQACITTRQYAKRQKTWFRNKFSFWQNYSVKEAGKLLDIIEENFL